MDSELTSSKTTKTKNPIRNPTKKWRESEEQAILNYLKDIIQDNKEIEKPTSKIFYGKMIHELKLDELTNLQQIKSKVFQLKKSYMKAIEWENQTGQGVEKGSVKEYIAKICPHYDILSEIFGNKTSIIKPPFTYDSTSHTEFDNFDEIIEVDEDLIEYADSDEINVNVNSSCSSNKNKRPADDIPDDSATIKKFKKYLTSKNKVEYKSDASSFLSDLQTQKCKAMEEKNEIEKLKVEAEIKLKNSELQLQREKFEFEKTLKIKEMEKKYEVELEIKKAEIESKERIEKMRMELALAIAKIQNKKHQQED